MKPILKAAMVGLLSVAIAAGGLLGLAGASFATSSAPPFEPDANAAAPYGNLTFYDANGDQVTSGTSLSSPFAYVAASTAADSGATKATLYFANPQKGVATGSWGTTNEAGPTKFGPSACLSAHPPTSRPSRPHIR